jgi:hypothetical protein
MTIVFVTTGAWGSGTGTPNSAAQVDGNFYDVDQRIVDIVADVAEGKRIDFVTYTDVSMTFHFTDASTQVIPLPVATLAYVGEWANSMPLVRGQMITAGDGFYQVLETHTTPDAPAVFDPNATDETTDQNPLYQLFLFVHSIPAEGETGQFLRKVTSADYDAEWQDLALDELSDVEVSTEPTEGHVLTFSGGVWTDAAATSQAVETTAATTIDPVLADAGKYWRCSSATDITVTIPDDTSVPFDIVTSLKWRQGAAGAVVLTSDTGVTLNSITGYLTESGIEGAVIEAIKVDTDEWDVFGLLAVE